MHPMDQQELQSQAADGADLHRYQSDPDIAFHTDVDGMKERLGTAIVHSGLDAEKTGRAIETLETAIADLKAALEPIIDEIQPKMRDDGPVTESWVGERRKPSPRGNLVNRPVR